MRPLFTRCHQIQGNSTAFELVQKWVLSTYSGMRRRKCPRCDKTAATRQDKAIHIVTAARCAMPRSRQFQQEHVGGDIMDPDVRCAVIEAGIARQQHFSLAALAP
jgi:hypothetical protein